MAPEWVGPALLILVLIIVMAPTTAISIMTDRKTGLAYRADKQHAALMRGDDRYGIYGNYPPEV